MWNNNPKKNLLFFELILSIINLQSLISQSYEYIGPYSL
jgi:hypothetical protein